MKEEQGFRFILAAHTYMPLPLLTAMQAPDLKWPGVK
jgi:hypothetical protein